MSELKEELKKLRRLTDGFVKSTNDAQGINRHEVAELDARVTAVEVAAGVRPADGGADLTGDGFDDDGGEKPLSRMNKAELETEAEARGITVPEGATVPEIRELLREE